MEFIDYYADFSGSSSGGGHRNVRESLQHPKFVDYTKIEKNPLDCYCLN